MFRFFFFWKRDLKILRNSYIYTSNTNLGIKCTHLSQFIDGLGRSDLPKRPYARLSLNRNFKMFSVPLSIMHRAQWVYWCGSWLMLIFSAMQVCHNSCKTWSFQIKLLSDVNDICSYCLKTKLEGSFSGCQDKLAFNKSSKRDLIKM